MSIKYKKFNKCPYCGSGIEQKFSGLEDRLQTVKSKFGVYECENCGLAFTNPIPEKNLSVLYPENYLINKSETRFYFDIEKWYRYDQYRFDFGLVKKLSCMNIAAFGSYLDIGCGSGERVEYVKNNGCKESYGLDKFDNLKLQMNNIFNSDILKFRPRKKYNVVSLFHVLEHIENLVEVVNHIKKNILKKGGYLIIQVPNYDSIERKLFKEDWFCFDVPRHIWHFRFDFLENFFVKHGFLVLGHKVKNAYLHPVSIGASIFKDMDIQRIWVLNKPFYYKFLWAIVTLLTAPLCWIENVFNKSSMLSLVLVNEKLY